MESHPDYFYEGSPFNNLNDSSGLFTAKDNSQIVLTDNAQVAHGTYLSIELKVCNSLTVLPSGKTCADEKDIQEFFNENRFGLFSLR